MALKKTVFPPFLPGVFNHVSGALTTELSTLPYIIIIITTIIVLIIIKVFLKRKILPLETLLSAYTRTHTQTEAPAHTSILTIQS